MKRFVKVLILFFLPILCGLGVLDFGMRSVPNDYSYKNKWLQQNISHIHIWTFGSSHGLYGINPKYFSKPAFNSAHVSQSLRYDDFIFNKFIGLADSLEWVVLPISYFTMTSCMELGTEWWRVKNYCLYYDCPYHKFEIKYNCEIIGNPSTIYSQIKRVGKYWIKGTDDFGCDSLGLDLGYSKDHREENWFSNGPQRVKYHTKNLNEKREIIQENTEYLKNIIVSCKERNVRVLLLTTPVCSTYYDNIDFLQYELMVGTCENLENSCDNVKYLNLLRDSRFVEDDFFDADHLETEGAAKLTRIVDEYLTNCSFH